MGKCPAGCLVWVAAPLLAGQDWAGAEYWTQVRPVAEEPRGGRRTD